MSLFLGAKLYRLALITLLFLSMPASAADLRGRVVNSTTLKPAAGDEVIVLRLSDGGMKEVSRTRTDKDGRFKLSLPDSVVTQLIRVIHQGVTYDHPVPSGTSAVSIDVYDVTAKLEDVNAIMDVERFEATHNRLEIKQLITMRNTSRPPRTVLNERPFEIRLPPEAELKSGLVQVEDAQPIRTKPKTGDNKGEYYFPYPMRPGDTRFGIVYQLPYDGEVVLEPQIRSAGERFVLMLPKSMKFEPKDTGIFQPRPDVSPDNVQGTAPVVPGQTLAFRISGTGMLAELQQRRQPALNAQLQALSRVPARPASAAEHVVRPPAVRQNRDSTVLSGLALALTATTLCLFLKSRSTAARAKMGTFVHSHQWQPRRVHQRVSAKFDQANLARLSGSQELHSPRSGSARPSTKHGCKTVR
jgi:hypothetical protein